MVGAESRLLHVGVKRVLCFRTSEGCAGLLLSGKVRFAFTVGVKGVRRVLRGRITNYGAVLVHMNGDRVVGGGRVLRVGLPGRGLLLLARSKGPERLIVSGSPLGMLGSALRGRVKGPRRPGIIAR